MYWILAPSSMFGTGSLTGLVPAMYLTTAGDQLSGSPDDTAGLYIQSRSGQVVKAVLPGNACAFQIGETSQIQSGGILQATVSTRILSALLQFCLEERLPAAKVPSFVNPLYY